MALGQPAIAIAGGYLDMCAVLADGAVKCWSAGTGPVYGLAGGGPGSSQSPSWLPVDLGRR